MSRNAPARPRTVLGLSSGSVHGNSETLLMEALSAARDTGATVEIIRVGDLTVPPRAHVGGPDALGQEQTENDGAFLWEHLLRCDGLIIASPIYSRCPPGKLKAMGDAVLGPQADVAFQLELKRLKEAGDPRGTRANIDERIFKPRAGGFIAVGGAISPEWVSFGLPLLHIMTFSMQIAVVDQIQVLGFGMPGAASLDEESVARARALGRDVALQAGLPYDEVEYHGEPGICPDCNLSMMILRGREAECAVCGMRGKIEIDGDDVAVSFPESERHRSILTIEGKKLHFDELMQVSAAERPRAAAILAARDRYAEWDALVVRPPVEGEPPTRLSVQPTEFYFPTAHPEGG
jgi:multimeric flavodoxin WrbA